MKKTNAKLAGEMSGHIFFSDKYFGYDDALYAAIRLLNIISKNTNIEAILTDFDKKVSTPEIKIFCEDSKKFEVIKSCIKIVRPLYKNIIFIDGLRVTTKEGWWLIRASNTQPAIIIRCEAKNKANLMKLLEVISNLLKEAGIQANLKKFL